MDYEQIRKDMKQFIEKLDGDGFRQYVDDTTTNAKILGEDLNGYYKNMLEMSKDLMTKEYVLATYKHGTLVYESQDVMIFLADDGYLEKLWMRNPGKDTWHIIPEVGIDFDFDEEDE